MSTINRMNVTEVRNTVNDFNMGYCSKKEYASRMKDARAPYVSAVANLLLYVRDRWF